MQAIRHSMHSILLRKTGSKSSASAKFCSAKQGVKFKSGHILLHKIRDLLAAESIDLNGKVNGKNEALDAMVALMAKSGKINDVEKYRKGVYAREEVDRDKRSDTIYTCNRQAESETG